MKRAPAAGSEPAYQATQQRSDSEHADAEMPARKRIRLYLVEPCVGEHRQRHGQKACHAAERIGQRAVYKRINKEARVGHGQHRQRQEERQADLSFEKLI